MAKRKLSESWKELSSRERWLLNNILVDSIKLVASEPLTSKKEHCMNYCRIDSPGGTSFRKKADKVV